MPVNGRGLGADSEYTAFVGSLTLYYWSVDISRCCAAMEPNGTVGWFLVVRTYRIIHPMAGWLSVYSVAHNTIGYS